MTSQDFVARLHAAIVEENITIYRDLFSSTSDDQSPDPYWKRALELFNSLSLEKREVFFEIVRQVTVDTTSNVLGVIDGVNAIGMPGNAFVLTCGTRTLNGDLQSLFLTEEEQRAR